MYYGAVDIDDGLSPNGGPGPEEEGTPASAEDEEENKGLDNTAGNKGDTYGPKIIRVPREPTPKEKTGT